MNRNIDTLLQEGLMQSGLRAYPELLPLQEELSMEIADSQFADLQCNSAMKWAKKLKKSPKEVAEQFLAHLDEETKSLLERTEIAAAGFINLWIAERFLKEQLFEISLDERAGIEKRTPTRVIIDFSSPNIAKEMHVGHLRSTIIGDCLARLFEFLGEDVLRLNHVGDWGTAFGMLIAQIKEIKPDLTKSSLSDLMCWYRESKERFDSDPHFKVRSQKEVVLLQGADPDSLKLWKVICAISHQAYQAIYDLLDVHLVERGESFYQPYLADTIREIEEIGLLTLSDGAKCVFVAGFEFPFMLQKSDGGYTYATTDLASLRHRIFEEKGRRLIYVVDAGQSAHFAQLFTIAKAAGYLDENQVQAEHVPFGLVLGPDGKKFKTRSGQTEKLIDLLQNAIDQSRQILRERGWEEEQIDEAARVLGVNAVKYADLSCQRTQNYSFSYERMLRFEGNTAAFLMYAYVRAISIQKRVGKKSLSTDCTSLSLSHPSERALALHLIKFSKRLDALAHDLMPHHLCEYLFTLAERFNGFFRDCRVEGTQQEASRLLLCQITAKTLHLGMQLLGLKTLDKM